MNATLCVLAAVVVYRVARVLWNVFKSAPEGYEDDRGFHYKNASEPRPVQEHPMVLWH